MKTKVYKSLSVSERYSVDQINEQRTLRVMSALKEISELGDDVQKNHTPLEICEMILSKVDLNKAKSILVLYNIELIFALKKAKYEGKITFLTSSIKKVELVQKMNYNVKIEYIDKEENPLYHLEMNFPKNFDIVLSNPPYSDQLHLKFFVRCIEIAKDKVVFVHPSTPYIDQKGVTPIYTEIKDLIKNKIEYLSIFNGNPDFDIRLKYPCSIIVVDKNKNNPEFIFDDQLNYKKPIKIDKIENISIFGNDLRFFSFKHKILSKLGETGNLHNRSTLGDKTANGNYMVTYSPIAGSTEDKDKEKRFTKSNYFIIAGRPHLEVLSPEAERKGITWYFDTEEEAKNFIEYTKLDSVRACVAITKISANLHRGELRTVPYLNFKEKWTEDKFNSFFSISDEEKGFIKEIIEPFY